MKENANRSARLQPVFESLETRALMAVVTWDGGGDATLWSDPINWVGDVVPLSTDDVVIPNVGPTTIVQIDASVEIAFYRG